MSEKQILSEWYKFRKVTTDKISNDRSIDDNHKAIEGNNTKYLRKKKIIVPDTTRKDFAMGKSDYIFQLRVYHGYSKEQLEGKSLSELKQLLNQLNANRR